MKKRNLIVRNASEVVTVSGFKAKKGSEMNELNIMKEASVVVENGKIVEVLKTKDLESKYDLNDYQIIDAEGKSVCPGFVDSHTHFVFAGDRSEEYIWRLKGDSYMSIMERGGGIANSVTQTREATKEELIQLGKKRLDSMMRFGVTTVEGKSGYGLDFYTEIKQLEVMRTLQNLHALDIVPTYLGAHAVPVEYKDRVEEYIDYMLGEVMPYVAKENLAEFCDVFCEKNVFSVEQSKRILEKGIELGLKPKLHADEIVCLNGAGLAADVGAISADHLLQASDEGLDKMREKDVVATILPITAFTLKESYARARYIMDNGGAVALATDMNPGSCYSESIPLMFGLATLQMNMTIKETLTALTLNGAAAIGKADQIGSIDPGKKADMIILDAPSYKHLAYHVGVSSVERVIKEGELIFDIREA
jgi:imidazolonepropionase